MEICFGDPIKIDPKTKINHETTPVLYHELEKAWDKLDHEQNPAFKYVPR
jgi:1-acyl-sn-glycerol-3-phosphate acyltransferase